MPIRNYPFSVISSGDIARPYLPVTIINPDPDRQLNVYALIDTGADECAFPASFAPILGHNLQAGLQKKISTGNGITIAYSHLTRALTCTYDVQVSIYLYPPTDLHLRRASF